MERPAPLSVIQSKRISAPIFGGVIFEFAIVIPILLLLVVGLLSIGLRYHAQAILSKGVEEGLDLASVVRGLESRAVRDGVPDNAEAKEQVLAEALKFPQRALFALDSGVTVNGIPGTATSGTRITSIELDIGEDVVPSEQLDLTDYLRNNPIIVTATAEVNNLLWFLPPWQITVSQAAQREPTPGSTLPRVFHCDGTPLTFEDYDPAGNCNCPGASDPRIIAQPPNCACDPNHVPELLYFPDDDNIVEPGECRCNPELYNDDGVTCSCKPCEDFGRYAEPQGGQGYSVVTEGMPDCFCGCVAPLIDVDGLDKDYRVTCECPNLAHRLIDGACGCETPATPCQGVWNLTTCQCDSCDSLNPPKTWNEDAGECVCLECECVAGSVSCEGITQDPNTCHCSCPPEWEDVKPGLYVVDCQCPGGQQYIDGSCQCLENAGTCAEDQKLFQEPCACVPCPSGSAHQGYGFDPGNPPSTPPGCRCLLTCQDDEQLIDNGQSCRCEDCQGLKTNPDGSGCECPFTEQELEAQCAQSQQLPDLANCACIPCPQGTEYVPGEVPLCQCPYYNENIPDGPEECQEGYEQFNPVNCSCCEDGKIFDGIVGSCVCAECDPRIVPPYGYQNPTTCECTNCPPGQGSNPDYVWDPGLGTCTCPGGQAAIDSCVDSPGSFDFSTCSCEPCAQPYMNAIGVWIGSPNYISGRFGRCECPTNHCHPSANLEIDGDSANPSDCQCTCPLGYEVQNPCSDGSGQICCAPPSCFGCTPVCTNGECIWDSGEG